jgi:hypothetical protein
MCVRLALLEPAGSFASYRDRGAPKLHSRLKSGFSADIRPRGICHVQMKSATWLVSEGRDE